MAFKNEKKKEQLNMKQRPVTQSQQIQAIYKEMANTLSDPKREQRRFKKLTNQLEEIPLTYETLPAWKKHYSLAHTEHEACPARRDIFHNLLIQRVQEIDPANQAFIDKFRQTFGKKLSNTIYWTVNPEARPKPPKKAQAT